LNEGKSNGLQTTVSLIFILLTFASGIMLLFVKFREKDHSVSENLEFKQDTPDLYEGTALELSLPLLVRARFFELKNESLYVEYYYNQGWGWNARGQTIDHGR